MSERTAFRSVERFSVYYGSGALDRLLRYDCVVVEPAHHSQQAIQALKDNGTIVLAYVSIMEVHDQHPLRDFASEEEYLREAAPPYHFIMQKQYQNRLVDMRSPSWRGHLLRHIGALITVEGYDGIFMDTIGDVEMVNMPNQLQQIEGAYTLVQQIRKWFPETILVQNNGLETLCNYTAPYLDAITWENPPLHLPDSKQWIEAVAERLVYLRTTQSLRVLILFEGSHQDSRTDFLRARSFAQEHGFTPYFSPEHYQSFR